MSWGICNPPACGQVANDEGLQIPLFKRSRIANPPERAVCEDDARLLARIDTTLQPYTDPATGHTTLFMDADKWEQIRRVWDDGDEMVAVTPMYEQ